MKKERKPQKYYVGIRLMPDAYDKLNEMAEAHKIKSGDMNTGVATEAVRIIMGFLQRAEKRLETKDNK